MIGRLVTTLAALLFVLFLGQGSAWATTCSVPNLFVNNTVADADTVNANFAAVLSCVNVGPAWTTYTPTVTCGTGGLGTSAFFGEYLRVGRMIAVNINVIITSNGTCAGSWTVTLPIQADASFGYVLGGRSTNGGVALSCGTAAGTSVTFCQKYDGGYFAADGQNVVITGVYGAVN